MVEKTQHNRDRENKRPYEKPTIQEVRLVPKESVLQTCRYGAIPAILFEICYSPYIRCQNA